MATLLFLLSVEAGPAAPATVRKPVVLSFILSTQHLSWVGGTVRLTAHVANATTCTFGAAARRSITLKCKAGLASIVEKISSNTLSKTETIRFWVEAKGVGVDSGKGRAFFENGGTTLYISRAPTPTTTTTIPTVRS